MLWAAVPEASVNKDCYFMFTKNKIRFAENLRFTSPTHNFIPAKNLN